MSAITEAGTEDLKYLKEVCERMSRVLAENELGFSSWWDTLGGTIDELRASLDKVKPV